MAQAFRPQKCGEASKIFCLRHLDSTAQYVITNLDVEGSISISGNELMETGLTVEIRDKPGAAVIAHEQGK